MATPGDRSVDLNDSKSRGGYFILLSFKGITPNQLFNYRTMGFDPVLWILMLSTTKPTITL